ncbi:hypothetical protein [Coleofasciculus sp. F4-SAH-05]
MPLRLGHTERLKWRTINSKPSALEHPALEPSAISDVSVYGEDSATTNLA